MTRNLKIKEMWVKQQREGKHHEVTEMGSNWRQNALIDQASIFILFTQLQTCMHIYIYNTHKEVHLLSSSCLLIPLIHPDVLTHPHLQHKSPATPSNTHTGLNVPHKRRQVNYITQRQFVSEPLTLIFDLVTGEQSVCEAGSRGIISWVINHKAWYLS